MLRVGDLPLHRRAYKQHTVAGTLHPPLAAAMAALADIRPGHTVLAPCRGSGTLPIEAALARPDTRFQRLRPVRGRGRRRPARRG